MRGKTIVVTGTDTGVGKTIVTAAVATLAVAAGRQVAVVKLAQSGVAPGEEGDTEVISRLSQPQRSIEYARYSLPLAPAAAIRVGGETPVRMREALRTCRELAVGSDLVLIEGSGGLLVELDDTGFTIADLAIELPALVIVVTRAGLGTLNHTALTLEALRTRGISLEGLVIGAWPTDPDLACRTNLVDLACLSGGQLSGIMPEGCGNLSALEFNSVARRGLAPHLGGTFPGSHRQPQRLSGIDYHSDL